MKKSLLLLLMVLLVLNAAFLMSCVQQKKLASIPKDHNQADEVSVVSGNTQASTIIEFPEFKEGTFFDKNWTNPIGTYKGAAVPNKETALEIAQAVLNGIKESNTTKQFIPNSVFYDVDDEIWIVSFSPISDDLPQGVFTVGGGCSIAIQKSDGKILRIWYGE